MIYLLFSLNCTKCLSMKTGQSLRSIFVVTGRNEVINYINSGHRNDTHSYDRPSHEECNSIHCKYSWIGMAKQ